jgi:hypothetical protein
MADRAVKGRTAEKIVRGAPPSSGGGGRLGGNRAEILSIVKIADSFSVF